MLMSSPVLPYFMQQKFEAAQAGSGDACFDLAEYYYAQKDYPHAFEWYQKAAAAPDPNPNAFFNLGYACQYGEGTPQDMIAAFDYYQKAAEQDLPQALNNLAYFYEAGIVVERDLEKADSLMRRATSVMNNLQTELYKTRRDNSALLRDQQEQAAAQAKLEARALQAEARLSAVQQECAALQQSQQMLQAAQADLEKQLEEAQQQYAANQAALAQAQQQEQTCREKYDASQAQCRTLQQKLETAERELALQKNTLEQQSQELRRCSESLQTTEAARDKLQASLSAEQSHVEALKQNAQTQNQKILQQTQEVQALREANKRLLARKPFIRKATLLLWTDLYVLGSIGITLFFPLTLTHPDTPVYLFSGILACLFVLGYVTLWKRKYILFALLKICCAAAFSLLAVVLFVPWSAAERLLIVLPLLWEAVHAFRKENA